MIALPNLVTTRYNMYKIWLIDHGTGLVTVRIYIPTHPGIRMPSSYLRVQLKNPYRSLTLTQISIWTSYIYNRYRMSFDLTGTKSRPFFSNCSVMYMRGWNIYSRQLIAYCLKRILWYVHKTMVVKFILFMVVDCMCVCIRSN